MLDAQTPQQRLSHAGFRYVLLHSPWSSSNLARLTQLTELLGQPTGDTTVAAWVIPVAGFALSDSGQHGLAH